MTFVTLLAVLLTIKSTVDSAFSSSNFFESSLSASVTESLARLISVWLYLLLKLLSIFYKN